MNCVQVGFDMFNSFLVAEWDTLYTFWDNIAHYKTESVQFWGLMNSATKVCVKLYSFSLRFGLVWRPWICWEPILGA